MTVLSIDYAAAVRFLVLDCLISCEVELMFGA
jgi:hypothetical protein